MQPVPKRFVQTAGPNPELFALFNKAQSAHQAGNWDEAEDIYKAVLAQDPGHAGALQMVGLLCGQRGDFKAAGQFLKRAMSVNRQDPALLFNYANVLATQGRLDDALAHYERTLKLKPDYAEAHLNRGNMLAKRNQYELAIASYDKAIKIRADYTEAHANRGNALHKIGRAEEAADCYRRAIQVNSNDADLHFSLAKILQDLGCVDEAVYAIDRAFELDPHYPYLEGTRINSKFPLCDWGTLDADCARLLSSVREGKPAAHPFYFLAIPGAAPVDQQICSERFVADHCPATEKPLWRGKPYTHRRIHVAYLSADFHEHATAYLAAGMFESHDKSRFETTAISFGPDEDSAMRRRLMRSFDRFLNVRSRRDQSVAELVRKLEVDIAIDLKGFTQYSRPGIFAHRPAPIQVNYLGHPGTLGAPYIDYIIADRCVIPAEHQDYYSEKVVYLPDTYQANDSKRAISESNAQRDEEGLPNDAFVFCAFNHSYKIVPHLFDVWMRLLREVPDSVLWLIQRNETMARNLRREAEARGISADRLVFAQTKKNAEHLARHRLADLFLDTLPYNAHTTASDALWAGLPVLTCLGGTFAGRVAASLLQAVGLPELITRDLGEYEALGLKLARDRDALHALKAKLARNRMLFPLFNTERFTRNIEAAYWQMWERYQKGQPAEAFAVGVPG